MSFRITSAGWLTMIALLGGCGLKFGQKAPPPSEMSMGKYSCVGQMAAKVEDYVNARMSESEINSFVGCLQSAFTMFNQTAHGHANWNEFAATELRTFIQTHFLPKDRTISDELLNQFMIIKENLVGGDNKIVNRSDLVAAVQILEKIRIEAVRLRPFLPYLNPRLVEYQDAKGLGDKLAEAERALNEAAEVFGGILANSKKPYSIENYETFLREFRALAHWEEHFDGGPSAKQWAALLSAFKAAAVSPDPAKIYSQDWTPLFKYGMQWYLNYIKFNVGIRNQPSLLEGPGFKNLVGLGDSVQNLLNVAIDRQPNRMISFEITRSLVAALKGVDWLPKKMRVDSVNRSLEALVNKVFGPEDMSSQQRASPGITKLTLANMMVEYAQWQEIQMALQEKYTDEENRGERLRTYGTKIPLLNLPLSISDKPYNRADWERFISNFQRDRALFKEDLDRVFLVEKERLRQFDVRNGFFNLSKMNVFRAILSLVFKGYASPQDGMLDARLKGIPLEAGIARDRFEAFYKDFRDFGIDIGLLDSRTFNAGERTFKEAKIFTYLADGMDDQAHRLLSYAQGIQEGAFLYSGGELSRDLYKRLSNDCPASGDYDIPGNSRLIRSCVREHLVDELSSLITTMPYYTAYLQHLNPEQRLQYADYLLNSAYGKFARPKDVELSELQTLSMVVHYSEALMTNYNQNLDDVLTENEINAGVPVFTGLIEEIAAKKNQWDPFPENTFKFIMANGKIPDDAAEKLSIAYHASLDELGDHENWGLVLDRMGIAKVFAAIISNMTEPAPKSTAPTPESVLNTLKEF